MQPRHLLHSIRPHKIKTTIQHRHKTLLIPNIHKIRHQLLCHLRRTRRSSRHNRILVQLVLLRERYRLIPSLILLVQVRRKSPILKQFVLL